MPDIGFGISRRKKRSRGWVCEAKSWGKRKSLRSLSPPAAQRVYRDLVELLDAQPRALTIDLLMAFPEHMRVIRRIQSMAATVYGEIRANLWHRDMKPMHLLRAKLSFLGAHRFDPKGDRWVARHFFPGSAAAERLQGQRCVPAGI
jgi:PleD family two-component response regulator